MKRLVSIAILILLAFAIIYAGSWLKLQLATDSCLDNGGRWNYDIAACDSAG